MRLWDTLRHRARSSHERSLVGQGRLQSTVGGSQRLLRCNHFHHDTIDQNLQARIDHCRRKIWIGTHLHQGLDRRAMHSNGPLTIATTCLQRMADAMLVVLLLLAINKDHHTRTMCAMRRCVAPLLRDRLCRSSMVLENLMAADLDFAELRRVVAIAAMGKVCRSTFWRMSAVATASARLVQWRKEISWRHRVHLLLRLLLRLRLRNIMGVLRGGEKVQDVDGLLSCLENFL